MRFDREHLPAPRLGLLSLLLVGVVALAGCKGVTPIKDLLDDPSRYEGQTVRIAGTVESSVGVLTVGAYKLDDGTGTITVVSKASGVPRQGAKVGVQGKVKAAFTLGSESLTVFLEDKRFTP
jgi:hypothetical protein